MKSEQKKNKRFLKVVVLCVSQFRYKHCRTFATQFHSKDKWKKKRKNNNKQHKQTIKLNCFFRKRRIQYNFWKQSLKVNLSEFRVSFFGLDSRSQLTHTACKFLPGELCVVAP